MSAILNHSVNPKDVVIEASRQRQENVSDIEDLKQSVSQLRRSYPESGGFINPIVVRVVEDKVILVAGERRLRTALALDLPDIPVRYFNELSEAEAEVVELEENIKRKELSWKDQVRAIGRLHILYKKNAPGWKIEQTAEAISLHHSYLRQILHVFDALDTGRVDKAESITQAYNTLHRFSERKAESIVGDIIVAGARLFAAGASALAGAAQAGAQAAATLEDSFTTTSAIKVAQEPGDLLDGEVTNSPALMSVGWNEATQTASIMVGTKVEAPPPPPAYVPPADPIICTNFVEWIKTYNGPKFSLIHCDFPYGNYRGGDSQGSLSGTETEEFYDNTEDVYWNLVDALTGGLDRIMSYSAHMIFWMNMNFYTETVGRLRKTGLMVHDHPLVWHKTGGPGGLGVVPGTAVTYPRRTYDTALLAVRGGRPLAKPGMNSYAAPTAGNKIHPSQKPEPMLRFFLSMVVDETTTMFDPTCGSGAALRAAEDLGAKSVLGIEMDENYAKAALTKTLQARVMRQAGQLRKEE
jgi:ParB/RepB/Spo0J family partition protein